jgi:acyl carrier protein phosphodiesterase
LQAKFGVSLTGNTRNLRFGVYLTVDRPAPHKLNYLAHFYLAGESPGLLIGNFIADAVKGSAYLQFPPEVQEGIRMHREIDHFTDTHPITSRSKDRLRAEFNHYSAVIVDVFYDHFLAKSWTEFSPEPLADYAQRIYAFLQENAAGFPERARFMLPHMIANNWLTAYAHIEGINVVMTGMSQRTKFKSGMENSSKALVRNYAEFEKDFRDFFPELVAHTTVFREKQP